MALVGIQYHPSSFHSSSYVGSQHSRYRPHTRSPFVSLRQANTPSSAISFSPSLTPFLISSAQKRAERTRMPFSGRIWHQLQEANMKTKTIQGERRTNVLYIPSHSCTQIQNFSFFFSPYCRIQSMDLLSHNASNKPNFFYSVYSFPGNIMLITPAARVPVQAC